MSNLTQAERITAVETRLSSLEQKVEKMDGKLDELLALRYKGAGAFWLGTTLFGVSLAGFFSMLFQWFGTK